MKDRHVYAIIMAGGIGTRLWPYSRQAHPKQFLDLLGHGYSLLQSTYRHILRQIDKEHVFVITHEEHADLVSSQLPELSPTHVLCEPARRNTAPCIAYASYRIQTRDPQAVTIVVPADHHITATEKFDEALSVAVSAARREACLVTLGIKPIRADTAYGYIQFLPHPEGPVKKVKTFTEKPELKLAQKFIESGDFLWNAGIFAWHVTTIIDALESHAPQIAEIFSEGASMYYTAAEEEFLQKAYSIAPTISIDYAIMEKYKKVYVVPCEFAWSDLGSWEALYETLPKDKNDNAHLGSEALTYQSKGNLLCVKKDKLLLIEGLDNFLVADFDDVLVICNRKNEAQFRQFVQEVKNKKGDKYI